MGRILVLLTFVSLAATFVVIYNISNKPLQTRTVDNSNGSGQRDGRPTRLSQQDKRKQTAASARGSSKSKKARTTSEKKDGTESTTTVVPDRAQVENSDPSMTVKNDSTPVYSVNSKRSSVVRRLRKGEKVEPDIEVIDSEGRWIVVKGREKERSGFVRDEQIARPLKDPASRTTKQIRER